VPDSSLLIKLGLNTEALVTGIARANGLMGSFQSTLQNFGRQVAGGVGFVSLGYAITDTVKSMADFQRSMSEVKAITGATGGEFEALRTNAIDLAGAFNALDISKLETEFGRLGFSTQEILDSTEATINLASATGSNLAESAVIAGSTLRAFNLDAKEMGRVTDVMAGALNRSGLDMSNFAEAIKYVAPNAHAAGISLEETAAMLGVLADNGIKGSMAGTSLRRIITDLSTEAKPLNEKLKELGDKGLNAADAMTEIGRIGATSLLVLAKNADAVANLGGELHNVTGEAKAMSDVMQDNLIGDWNKLNAAFDKFKQDNSIVDGLRLIVQQVKNMVDAINAADFTKMEKLLAFATGGIGGLSAIAFAQKGINADNAAIASRETAEVDPITGMTIGGGTAYKPPVKRDISASYDDNGAVNRQIDKVKYFEDLSDALEKVISGYQGLSSSVKDLSGEEESFFGNSDEVNASLQNFSEEVEPSVQSAVDSLVTSYEKLKKSTISTGASLQQMGRMLRQTFVNIAVDIGRALGDAMSGGSNSIEKILLGTLGSVLVQMGHMAITIGIGMEAIKESFKTLNPAVALAAGIGLVALGTYFSNQSNAIGNSFGGGSSGAGSSIGANQTIALAPGMFKIQGRDLVYAYDKNKALNNFAVGG